LLIAFKALQRDVAGMVAFDEGVPLLACHLALSFDRVVILVEALVRLSASVGVHPRMVPVATGVGLTVSPDRKTFLFTAWKPDHADLMLIENFR
jgi:hypothetical protein